MDSSNGELQVEPTTAQRWMSALFRAFVAGFIAMVVMAYALPPKPDTVGIYPVHSFVYGLTIGLVLYNGYKGWHEARGTPRPKP